MNVMLAGIERKRIKGVSDTLLMQELSIKLEKANKLIERLHKGKRALKLSET